MNETPRLLPRATKYQFLQRKEKGIEVHKIRGMLVVIGKKRKTETKNYKHISGEKEK